LWWASDNPSADWSGHPIGFTEFSALGGALLLALIVATLWTLMRRARFGRALLAASICFAALLLSLNVLVYAFRIPVLHVNPWEGKVWLSPTLGLPPIARLPSSASEAIYALRLILVLHALPVLAAASAGFLLALALRRLIGIPRPPLR
jgi:hypothetical protein